MTLLQLLGPAAIPTIICLIVGLVMLVIEMFTPGFGAAGTVGFLCLIAAIAMQFIWGETRVALYIMAIVLLIIVLALILFVRSFQKGKLSRSFLVLDDKVSGESVPDVESAAKDLIGKTGVSLTPLRPSGIADIGGKRVDVMTAGAFIEKDRTIEVVNAEGMHILVREPVKAPISPAGEHAEQPNEVL